MAEVFMEDMTYTHYFHYFSLKGISGVLIAFLGVGLALVRDLSQAELLSISVLITYVLFLFLIEVIFRFRRPRQITVDRDGISWISQSRRWFIPWSKVTKIEVHEGRYWDHITLFAPRRTPTAPYPREFCDRIVEAVQRNMIGRINIERIAEPSSSKWAYVLIDRPFMCGASIGLMGALLLEFL